MGQMLRLFCSTDIFLELCIISQLYMFGYSSTIQSMSMICEPAASNSWHMLINWLNEIIIPNFKVNKERVKIDINLIKAKFQGEINGL